MINSQKKISTRGGATRQINYIYLEGWGKLRLNLMKSYFLSVLLLLGAFFPGQLSAQEKVTVYSVEDTFTLALQSHPRILAAERQIFKSRLLADKARSEILPRLNIYGFYQRADDAIEYNNLEVEAEEKSGADFSLVQPLFNARYFPLKEQAVGQIDSTMEAYYQTIQDTLYWVAETYYQVLEAEELVRNAEEYVKLAAEELRVSEIKFNAGDVTEDVKIRSELSVTKAEGNLIAAKNQLLLAKDILKSRVGIKEADFAVQAPPELLPPQEEFSFLFDRALDQRRDYRMALHDVDFVESDIKLVKAKFYPSLEGTVDYYLYNDPAYDEDSNYLVGAIKLNIPLYEGGIRYADLKEKRETLKQAQFAVQEIKDNIKIEIKQALINIESYGSQLGNLRKQVELARKTYEITNTQFSYGAATGLDLDQTITTLDSVKTELITTTYEYQMELLNLRKVVGIFVNEKLKYE